MPRRIAARLVTGPVSFLLAGAADLAVLAVRLGWARARGRDPWG